MQVTIQLHVNDSLYLRNPEETELGKKLVSEGIILIDEIGFQEFTFKKLAKKIKSTEASIYRYFKSKQHLLQYIVAWYCLWLKYVITIRTANIKDPNECLKIAINVLIDSDKYDPDVSHIDEHALFKIIIAESARVNLTRQEDDIKGKDLFDGYQQLISLVAGFIKDIKSNYKYPVMLSHTLVSAVHKQVFFCEHFPKSIIFKGKKGERKEILNFINNFVSASLA